MEKPQSLNSPEKTKTHLNNQAILPGSGEVDLKLST